VYLAALLAAKGFLWSYSVFKSPGAGEGKYAAK